LQKLQYISLAVFIQLGACLHMKFGNVEAVATLFLKKKTSRKGSFIENIGRFDFHKQQNLQ